MKNVRRLFVASTAQNEILPNVRFEAPEIRSLIWIWVMIGFVLMENDMTICSKLNERKEDIMDIYTIPEEAIASIADTRDYNVSELEDRKPWAVAYRYTKRGGKDECFAESRQTGVALVDAVTMREAIEKVDRMCVAHMDKIIYTTDYHHRELHEWEFYEIISVMLLRPSRRT